MDDIASLLARNGLLPHGYCITWRPGLLWTLVISDALIALAYFSIPLAIWHFMRKRRETALNGVMGLFAAFIFACSLTHVMDVWTVWRPDYVLQAITKAVAAALSVGTAIALWPLIPKALAIPSIGQLRAAIRALEHEVGQRRSMEDSLADTQGALMITLASIGAGFIATDREGRITAMNKAAEQFTGWTRQEALGQSYWTVFTRDDRPDGYESRNPVDVMMDIGATIDKPHYMEMVSRTGTRTPVEVKVSLTHTPDGQVRGMAVVLRDMTTLYEAQAESSRLAAIVASSQDAIIGKTLEGRIISWNEGAHAMFGYTADEVIGQSIEILHIEGHGEEEQAILRKISAGLRVPVFEAVRRHKSGELVHVSVTISPIRNAHGKVVGAAHIARDIGDQRRAEAMRIKGEKLEAENRQIQEANRLKSEFLANMSHELRTPLNAIIGFADLLHTGAVPADSPKHREFLGHIGTSGRHLLRLINDVLDLSKVEAGKVEFHPEPISLQDITKEVTDILLASAGRQGVELDVDIDPRVNDLVLDPAKLKQVLYNYLSNAIKFTPRGGRVTLRAMPEGQDKVRIEVEDTGIGIAADDIQKLFIEFQQLDSVYTKKHQGTGLGLALTRRLVEAQGGTVGVRSTPGIGSVFHLILDKVMAEPPQPGTHRILVIQDDPDEQSRMQGALQEAGFAVDAAATGEQALAHAHAHAYDAITLDLCLPDRTGLEVLSRIRGQSRNGGAPVVAVTMASGTCGTATFAIADVLSKPIETGQIGQALSQVGLAAGSRARVMVVDDDPMALDLMHVTLNAIGLQAIGLTDGRQALAELDQHRPDAIILDLMMPEFDGFSVLEGLRQLPRWRDTPVFIWTSMLLTDDEYASLSASASAILGKGGGALDGVLQGLRRWHPPPPHATQTLKVTP